MLETSRRLLAFRKSIIHLLTDQFGYYYEDERKHRYAKYSKHPWAYGPRVRDYMLFPLLEDINTGEAHYRPDMPCHLMKTVGGYQAKPKDFDTKQPRLTQQQAIERFFDLLYCGWEFEIKPGECGYDPDGDERQYDVVKFIDWLSPKKNHFSVHEAWRGVRNDRVAWDLIITVNAIPLISIMIAPTTEGHRPCEEAYAEFRRQLDADPCLNTYLLCSIISDGKTTLVGSADDPAEWYFPWDPCDKLRDEAKQKDIKDRLLPFYALLEPTRLITFLQAFVHLVGEGDEQMRYVGTSHQYEAVMAAADHLLHGSGQGFAVLPEAEEEIRSYPFENNYNTTRQLFVDYATLSGVLDNGDPDADKIDVPKMRFWVQPTMSTTIPDGICVYRPSTILKSPLAD